MTFSINKIYEKSFLERNFAKTDQNQTKNYVFCHFLKFGSLIFLDIAQDCSLGQCLTSSRVKTSKTKFCVFNWGRNDLFYYNVVKRPLKLAYQNLMSDAHFASMLNVDKLL